MKVGYVFDPTCQRHNLSGHPENATRLDSVMPYLQSTELYTSIQPLTSDAASRETLCAIHNSVYVNLIENLSRSRGGMLGSVTYVGDATFDAASRAAGAAIAATRAVLDGDVDRAYALVRPPGHHAFAGHGEGFCIFNNIAFAASFALGRLPELPAHALERVMIIDFDVHHGNGTESIFYQDPDVLYVSTHESPLYPESGFTDQVGRGAGKGATINIPLPAHSGNRGYLQAFESIIVPAARRFKPQLILASVGYDAHWRDPLADMGLSLTGYTNITQIIAQLSDELCDSRAVFVLEGGYDLEVLRFGVYNTFCVLMNDALKAVDPIGPFPGAEPDIRLTIRQVQQQHHL